MGKQKLLVNVHEDETRIALIENGLLTGLHHQQTSRERTVGNIYKGIVVKVNPAFQAAFVDYGEKRNGFLSISDINPAVFKNGAGGAGRPRIQSVLRPGQEVMVQVLKEGMREKGAALTTFIGLPGRYLVYTPNSERSGVSRKIEDADKRHALRDILHSLLGEDDPGGVIIRTAGIDRPAADLKRDLAALKKEWKAIQERFAATKKAGLVHQEASSIVRVLRDYFTENIEEVWVDSPDAYQEALGYFKAQLPKFQKRLRLYVGDLSIFSAHNIEDQIEALGSSRVPLKSGGSIVIEPTEAMVAIDVNSGRSNQESDIEDTALRTNLEAAEEVARQLRLRNLGGLIVVDFIDMFQAKNRAKVRDALIEFLKQDKARTTVGTISQFGLLEMSRQRIDMEISVGMRVKCPHCGGTGHIPTVNTSANNVLRKIRALAATGKYAEIHGTLPLELANYLLNHKRESLRDLELEFDIQVHLFGDPALSPGQPVQLSGAGGKAAESEARTPEVSALERAGRRRGRRSRPAMEEAEAPAALPDSEEESLEVLAEGDRPEPFSVEPLDEEEPAGAGEVPPPRARRGREGRPPRERGTHAAPPGGNGRPTGEAMGEIFVSTHRITHPDLQPPLPEARRRTSPFAAVAAGAESGLLFDSSRPGVTDIVPLPPPSEIPEKVGRRVSPEELSGLISGGKAPAEAERYEEETVAAPAEERYDEASSPEEETEAEKLAAEDSQAPPGEARGADQPRTGRRRRRGRRGRGRGRGSDEGAATGAMPAMAGEGTAAGAMAEETAGDSRPEPGNEKVPQAEPPDEDEYLPGNTIEPEPQRTQRPRRRGGRGRGRGRGRRSGQGSGQPVAAMGGE
jgi:ribonuclease E